MLWQRITYGNERRGLRQAVDVCHLPAQLTLEALDGGRRGRGAGGHDMHAARNTLADLGGSIGQADQHRRRGTEPGDAFLADQPENRGRIGLGQADMSPARGGHDPNEGPAVGVEHRQRPQVTIADPKRQVD